MLQGIEVHFAERPTQVSFQGATWWLSARWRWDRFGITRRARERENETRTRTTHTDVCHLLKLLSSLFLPLLYIVVVVIVMIITIVVVLLFLKLLLLL